MSCRHLNDDFRGETDVISHYNLFKRCWQKQIYFQTASDMHTNLLRQLYKISTYSTQTLFLAQCFFEAIVPTLSTASAACKNKPNWHVQFEWEYMGL